MKQPFFMQNSMSPATPSNAHQVCSFSVEIDTKERQGWLLNRSRGFVPLSLQVKCREWDDSSIQTRANVAVCSGGCCSVVECTKVLLRAEHPIFSALCNQTLCSQESAF